MNSQTGSDAQGVLSPHFDIVSNSLTRCEAKVARVFVQNANECADLTVREMSRMAHVSPPTVLRFFRKIGYGGFADFKSRFSNGNL